MDLLAKTSSGDIKGAAQDFAHLRDSSEIVVQANTIRTTTPRGFDVDVANAKMSEVKSHNIATWVKPAHGHFAKLQPSTAQPRHPSRMPASSAPDRGSW
jgi:hypothetical protein